MRPGALLFIAAVLTPLVARAQDDAAATPQAGGDVPSDGEPSAAPAAGDALAPDASVSASAEPPAAAPMEISQDATVIEGQRLRDSARPSTFEALSQESADIYVPGRGAMHGVASGGTGGIRIRGLGGSPNSQVLVVEDGVPDYQGIFGHPIPDAYVPFLIDDALVIKGGDSALYGTNAMGGVVVIRSRWRGEDGYEMSSDSAYGSYATVRETVSGLGRAGPWDVAAGFHTLSTDGHRDGAGGDQMVGVAAARYRFAPNLRLTARNKVVHLGGADPGPATHPNPDHWYHVWRDTASLQLGWELERLRLTMTPYLNVGVHELYDGFHSNDYVGGGIADVEFRVLFYETRRVAAAMAVRGASSGGLAGWRVLFALPQVWLPRIIVRAERVGTAMELRGYCDGPLPTSDRAPHGLADVTAIGTTVGAMALAICLRIWGSP